MYKSRCMVICAWWFILISGSVQDTRTTAARLRINNERCRTVANHLQFHLLARGS
jgi:hypothetical protein